jgi:hypothetical protein
LATGNENEVGHESCIPPVPLDRAVEPPAVGDIDSVCVRLGVPASLDCVGFPEVHVPELFVEDDGPPVANMVLSSLVCSDDTTVPVMTLEETEVWFPMGPSEALVRVIDSESGAPRDSSEAEVLSAPLTSVRDTSPGVELVGTIVSDRLLLHRSAV